APRRGLRAADSGVREDLTDGPLDELGQGAGRARTPRCRGRGRGDAGLSAVARRVAAVPPLRTRRPGPGRDAGRTHGRGDLGPDPVDGDLAGRLGPEPADPRGLGRRPGAAPGARAALR